MKISNTPIEGLLIIEPKVWEDGRGYFFESYNRARFGEQGISKEFVQDNQSLSQKNSLRGLHFQAPPYAQAKLVRVIKGSVLDVAVDIRKDSPTYGQSYSLELNESNMLQLYVPEGFAHGFRALEDETLFFYKCSALYNKASERGILWNDPDLNIDWGIREPVLSEKDSSQPLFKDFVSPF